MRSRTEAPMLKLLRSPNISRKLHSRSQSVSCKLDQVPYIPYSAQQASPCSYFQESQILPAKRKTCAQPYKCQAAVLVPSQAHKSAQYSMTPPHYRSVCQCEDRKAHLSLHEADVLLWGSHKHTWTRKKCYPIVSITGS